MTRQIEDYDTGNPNRQMQFGYNMNERVKRFTAENSVNGNQVTTYGGGTIMTDSYIASNDLLRAVIYPDSTDPDSPLSGTDHVEYRYNRLGERREITDQLETVRVLEYDKLGRLSHDRVTTSGVGVDPMVLRISRTYEARGLLLNITSYDNATPGAGTVLNDVQFAYNNFSQLITEYQEHGGAVNAGTSPKVQYAYANGSTNQVRLISVTYPSGQVLTSDYGPTPGIDDALSRVNKLVDGGADLVLYSYLGREPILRAQDAEPRVEQIRQRREW